ncbi:MAG: inositol monophosphatase [Ruminococcus sp.]|nr:inositol monophosphatase [Ruminococcus sp.]
MMKNIDVEKIIEAVKSTKAIVLDEKLRTQISMKGEADFVTEVDYQISKYLEKELSKLTPDIGFMSEEEDTQIVPTRWILDPIDGTTNLVYGYNVCSVSLALCVDEVIEFGVVYNPFNGDVFTGYRGKGAFFNGKKLPQIPDRELENCLIEFGAGSTRKEQADVAFAIGKHVFKNCLDLRRVCSSALSVCYVAQGRLNGYFEKELKPWDYAAAGLILEECGGKMCDWYGDKIRYTAPSGFICGSEKAFDFLKQTIREFDQ